ncbi:MULTISPECIES: response regulator [unclassified Haladaptatus]|uniref:response regulator n=1 Tax=unclassified Haladaptatus TaxID=2622732 RepID=UPI0023E8F8C9|nr:MULTISPECIES: response regulator [unclassified Haladaptatus]
MGSPAQPVVLIVDDEPDIAETYELWLSDRYQIKIAGSGDEALSKIDTDVDVVLLDRMMPGMSGEEVLTEIRTRDIDCRVAMVTAVDPSFDIIEMGFDEYVVKPPSKERLRATVEQLVKRGELNTTYQEYFSLIARQDALQAEFSPGELADSPEYNTLLAQIEAQESKLKDRLGELNSDANFIGAIREIMRESESMNEAEHTTNNSGEHTQ